MPSFKTVTFGCKVNQYETQYVCEGLQRLGYREAADDEQADWCLVNTCTVTAEGDLKSRKAIRQLARTNPRAEIVVMGCYATRDPEAVAALPGVVEVITDKQRLGDLLARLGLVDVPDGISTFGRRHRAYVKVQDGCQMGCTYCILPTVRPVLVSRPPGEVLNEIGRLVERKHREIVLTGIHLGHYGVDLNAPRSSGAGFPRMTKNPIGLADLVAKVVDLPGKFRVRISSLEADEATAPLLALMAARPDRVCPHLHLSMQSGSDSVLARMGRRWSATRFVEQCQAVGESLDSPALTTDVIVGFPGETEAEFEATCRVVEQIGFAKVHVFRFSPRRGTPAADLSDQVPNAVKQRRAATLSDLGRQLRLGFLEGLIAGGAENRRLEVLVESPLRNRPGWVTGTSARYACVVLPGGPADLGQLVWVSSGQVVEGRIWAEKRCTPPARRPLGSENPL